MMAGAPDPVVEVITVKVALFETTDALATETLMVPEEETSFEGTITDIVSHCAMLAMLAGQWTGAETDEGESVSLPKRRIYVKQARARNPEREIAAARGNAGGRNRENGRSSIRRRDCGATAASKERRSEE